MIVTDRKGRKRREPDDYIVADGESTHSSMLLMDAFDAGSPVQIPRVVDALGNPAGHRPGPVFAGDGYRARDNAYDQFVRELGDAWKQPTEPDVATRPNAPTRDAAASRQAAYDAYVRD